CRWRTYLPCFFCSFWCPEFVQYLKQLETFSHNDNGLRIEIACLAKLCAILLYDRDTCKIEITFKSMHIFQIALAMKSSSFVGIVEDFNLDIDPELIGILLSKIKFLVSPLSFQYPKEFH